MGTSEHAIIVAGGTGSRMKSSTSKQFLEVGGLPIVMHSLYAFHGYSKNVRMTLVLPQDEIGIWHQLIQVHNFKAEVQIVSGGPTRFDSVYNGLRQMGNEGLVAIHDGVRPFVSKELIAACYQSAAQHGSGIAVVNCADSIRRLEGTGSAAVQRDQYRLVQTPQTFQATLIKQAYEQADNNHFTDDASVFESGGNSVSLVQGSPENFKITNQMDLLRARSFSEFKNLKNPLSS